MRLALLALHLILIALGTGMSFSNVVNLQLANGQSGDIAKGLALQRRTIARFADGVIALIWITGIVLLWQRGWPFDGWIALKLAFVVALTACHGLARATAGAMARGGGPALMPRLRAAVAGVWLSAMAAIVCAVLAFGV